MFLICQSLLNYRDAKNHIPHNSVQQCNLRSDFIFVEFFINTHTKKIKSNIFLVLLDKVYFFLFVQGYLN